MKTIAFSASLLLGAALLLTGCDADPAATPATVDPAAAAPDSPATPGDAATDEEDGLDPLPADALIRISAIAVAPGSTRMSVVLTVDEPTTIAAAAAADRSALETGCANTIRDAGWGVGTSSRLSGEFGGFITATLDVQGVDWPAPSLLYTGYGTAFHWASAPNVLSPDDSVEFGCFEPVRFNAAGSAHLVGVIDAVDYNGGIDGWLRFASFGFGEAYPATSGVTFEDCAVELSAHAQAQDDLWLSPSEWGSGCVIGYQRSEHD